MYRFRSREQAIDDATPKADPMMLGCISVPIVRLADIIAAKNGFHIMLMIRLRSFFSILLLSLLFPDFDGVLDIYYPRYQTADAE